MTQFRLAPGFWARGRFWRPISEVRAHQAHRTGYVFDATDSSPEADTSQQALLDAAGRIGLSAVAAAHPTRIRPLHG